jgi:hypothetical protein
VKRYWEIIADNLSKAGWTWGCVATVDCEGRTIWIADAHRDDGNRFVVRADDFDSALCEAGWKPLRIKNRTVLAYGVSVATVEGTAAAQICTRKQNNERTK